MSRNLSIERLCYQSKSWDLPICPDHPFAIPSVAERSKDCFRSAENTSIGFDQLHRSIERFRRNLRETFGHFLGRRVIDSRIRQAAPTFNPFSAKVTAAIENQKRFQWRVTD